MGNRTFDKLPHIPQATTTEQLGFVGRKEGIASHAVALLIQVGAGA